MLSRLISSISVANRFSLKGAITSGYLREFYAQKCNAISNRELRDKTLLIRQRATKALTDYLHDHEHIAEAIKEGVVGSLNFLLKDPDVHVRAYATECLRVISQHHLGREAVLHENVLLSFIDLVKMSEVDIIRLTAQKTIELITMLPSGVNAAIELGYIEILGECARNEVDEIKVVVLTTLNHILNTNTTRALAAGQSRLFTRLLLHPSEDIRATAAQNILRLCVDPRGKQEALDEETIPALVKLLADNCWQVRASATGALAFACTTNHGRYAAVNCGAIPLLLNLVDDENSRVRVNTLKVITCLSETPEGRRILLDHLDKIVPHENDENANVSKHARIAVSVITWKP